MLLPEHYFINLSILSPQLHSFADYLERKHTLFFQVRLSLKCPMKTEIFNTVVMDTLSLTSYITCKVTEIFKLNL